MATVFVNDKPVDIGNDKLNLIQAAERGGVYIPRYCWHPALSVVASCRMCLVEVGEKKPDGSVAMQPRVVPACQTPAKDGTVVLTNSPRAKHAQRGGRDANGCGEGLNFILEGLTPLLQEPVLILLDQILQPSASPPPEMNPPGRTHIRVQPELSRGPRSLDVNMG